MGLDRNKSGVGHSSRSGKELTRWMAKDSHLLAPASASQRNTPRFPVIEGDYGEHQYAEFDTALRPW